LIRRSGYIFVLAALFLGVAKLLHTFDLWSKIGVHAPHGYEVQGLLFLTLLFILQNTLFAPYTDVLDERENQTVKKKEAAEKSRAEADRMIAEYRKSIEEARIRATMERERLLLEADQEERKRLMQAKEAGTKSLAAAVDALKGEAKEAKKRLDDSVATLAKEIADRVVSVPSAVGERTPIDRRASV
jgi:F-type H+-transporting ATPase subunit b